VCDAIVSLCVPYRTIELGVQQLIALANRDVYPESEYPNAQWDYMIAYEQMPDVITNQFAAASDKVTKLMFSKANPANWQKPALTASVMTRGSWFGKEASEVPDIPLEYTVLDQELYDALKESLGREKGWWCATAYYRNHEKNREEHQLEKLKVKEGKLEMPVLHVDARYDIVCSAETHPGMVREMKERCADLRIEVVEAGHWVNLEKADEVNALMEGWLKEKGLLPGNKEGGTVGKL
jgi:soluble epoxide hydrolase / lipid-phosphate phosphatase